MTKNPAACQEDRWEWNPDTFVRQAPIRWDADRLGLFLTKAQWDGHSGITGTYILAEARSSNAPLANINLFEFLREHPHKAPLWVRDGWYLFFPIPLYHERKGPAYARYLHWDRVRSGFQEGDTLFEGAGFSAKCGFVTYEGIMPF